jgi:hypothetical protein
MAMNFPLASAFYLLKVSQLESSTVVVTKCLASQVVEFRGALQIACRSW